MGEVEDDDAGDTVVVEVAVEVGAVLGADERDPYPGNPPWSVIDLLTPNPEDRMLKSMDLRFAFSDFRFAE